MSWNYRVMRSGEGDDVTYAIHEGYYDKDGKLNGWTENAIAARSDSRDGMLLVLAQMAEAIGQPVLDAGTGHEVEPAKVLTDNLVRQLKAVQAEMGDATCPANTDGEQTEGEG